MAKEKVETLHAKEVKVATPQKIGGVPVARTTIGELYHKIHHTQRTTAERVIELPSPGKEPSIPAARVITEDAAERSKRVREQIWLDATANAAYYEECALKDELRKPWFHYVRKPYQYGEFILLSPEMAKELLRYNPDNRNLKPWLTAAYKRDMDGDNWIPSHEGIGINLSGNMFDGQHRAEAVVEAKKSVPIWIVFNVLDEAKFVADSGAKRNVNEKLAMVCNVKLRGYAGMIKAMMRGAHPRFKYSEAEIAVFAVQYQSVLHWMNQHMPIGRADVQAALGKAYLWFGPEKLEAFCTRMREARAFAKGHVSASPNWTGDDDPAKTLFFYLQRISENKVSSPVSTYKKTLTAIEHVVNDKPCNKLYERSEDLFDWEIDNDGNYHVPVKAA